MKKDQKCPRCRRNALERMEDGTMRCSECGKTDGKQETLMRD